MVPALLLALVVWQISCGVKAPPQPREAVVPEPVQDLSVQFGRDQVRLAFTLPAKSMDGTRLARIGGYRILRDGPDGRTVRAEVMFSTTEQVEMRGKRVEFMDALPEKPGDYRYCAIPLDPYGSHPRSHVWVGAYSPGSGVPAQEGGKRAP